MLKVKQETEERERKEQRWMNFGGVSPSKKRIQSLEGPSDVSLEKYAYAWEHVFLKSYHQGNDSNFLFDFIM